MGVAVYRHVQLGDSFMQPLSKGADLIVNNGRTAVPSYWSRAMAVSALSSGSSAVVCYADEDDSYKGVYETLCKGDRVIVA